MSSVEKAAIVFIDSGVGGLPYFGAFRALEPSVPAAYVADRANFPYGPKSKGELVRLLVELTGAIAARLDPRIVVVACNTASVSALDELRREFSSLAFVGTVPAVKPAALYSRKRRVGVLATERTVRDPYVALLAERFAPDCELVSIAAPELVEFVELEYPTASAEARLKTAKRYMDAFRAAGADAVVLGCTHFLFLAEEFEREGGEDIAVFDSRGGVAQRARSLLVGGPSVADSGSGALFVTGNGGDDGKWRVFGSLFGLPFAGPLEAGR